METRTHPARRTLQGAFLVTLAALVAACSEPPRRPNVLILSIDTLRADHLGCYGYERPTSPRIDDFAAGAILFEEAHTTAPWTLPALASLHTGLTSSAHGCDRIETRLDTEYVTLAEHLRDAGWDTALVACHVFLGSGYGLQQGFTHVDQHLITTAAELDQSVTSPGMTERGLRFLEAKAGAADGVPWLLWLHYFDPHADYLVHEGFHEPFGTAREIDCYDGEIAFTDHHIGRVLAALDALGLQQDTIVILVADHGEEFGEHGDFRHGTNLYQEVMRVPLILRAPGLGPARIAEPVGITDVLPTLLELCGVPARRPMEGQSLLPLVRGEAGAPRELLLEVRWRDGQDLRGLRHGAWKYCEYRQRGQGPDLLFDLAHDPRERHDRNRDDRAWTEAQRLVLDHALDRARALSFDYPRPQVAAPSPADAGQLERLGYVGDDGRATEAPR
ncbi:MAG: sulfatase [Planctomycetes bacterium]|nr:sulfatase [Planctomycetota bacterium]